MAERKASSSKAGSSTTGEPEVGDAVSWNTPQGPTHGTVVERRTKNFQLAKQKFTASDDRPMFIVESDKSGHRAAHQAQALTIR